MVPSLHSLAMAPPEVAEAHKFAYWSWSNPTARRTLLCVHGLTRNGRDFDYLAQGLSDHYSILSPDMPGRGKSDWLGDTKNYNYDTYLADILALLDSRKLTQIDWVGTSMGGILGMRVAAERPGLIRKLVLNDIGAVIPLAGLKRINDYVGFDTLFSDREAAEKHLRWIMSTFGIAKEEHWKHFVDCSFTRLSNGEYQIAYDPGILDPMRDSAKMLTTDTDTLLWGWWDNIKCPVLIIRGEHSDILTPQILEEMVKRHTATATYIVPDAGHAPTLMEAEQISFIKGWLLD